MDWTDPSQLEAFARNWLVELGREIGLPLMGRDWELAALGVTVLIAAWIWFWPSRRAFRGGGALRWIVLALNLGAIWFLPLWVFAVILSAIRKSSPGAKSSTGATPWTTRAASKGTLFDIVKSVAAAAQRRQGDGVAKKGGPWGKTDATPPSAPATTASRPAPTSNSNARKPVQAMAVSARRGTTLPNRQTWIRRRD